MNYLYIALLAFFFIQDLCIYFYFKICGPVFTHLEWSMCSLMHWISLDIEKATSQKHLGWTVLKQTMLSMQYSVKSNARICTLEKLNSLSINEWTNTEGPPCQDNIQQSTSP